MERQTVEIDSSNRALINEYLCNLTYELDENPCKALAEGAYKWGRASETHVWGSTSQGKDTIIAHYDGFNLVTKKEGGKLRQYIDFVEIPIHINFNQFTKRAEGLAEILGVDLDL